MLLSLQQFLSVVLATIIPFAFNLLTLTSKTQTIAVNKYEMGQTFETFGTSSAWWAQTIESAETADEIARLLYDKDDILRRYNTTSGSRQSGARFKLHIFSGLQKSGTSGQK